MNSRAAPIPILVVAGPTASGKSALALHLAETLLGTIINADSMQVYRHLPILTAQPNASSRARAPHLLYGMVDEADAFSAGQWRGRAVAEIAAVRAAGRLPILAGGTGLYLKVLIEGIAPVPRIPTAIRDEARTLHAALGPAAFHAALARIDPAAAARLAPGDRQRVVRAYEVVAATGHPLAEWQAASPAPEAGFDATLILLLPPRAPLYEACDARFLRMLDEGAETEVEALLDRGLDPALPAMRALGVGELARWKHGEITQGNAIAAAQQAIRNYAKRQYTWFKHQIKPGPGQRVRTIDAQFSERILPEVYSFIRH